MEDYERVKYKLFFGAVSIQAERKKWNILGKEKDVKLPDLRISLGVVKM